MGLFDGLKSRIFMKAEDGEYKPLVEIKEVPYEPRRCFGRLPYRLRECNNCDDSVDCLKRKIENNFNHRA